MSTWLSLSLLVTLLLCVVSLPLLFFSDTVQVYFIVFVLPFTTVVQATMHYKLVSGPLNDLTKYGHDVVEALRVEAPIPHRPALAASSDIVDLQQAFFDIVERLSSNGSPTPGRNFRTGTPQPRPLSAHIYTAGHDQEKVVTLSSRKRGGPSADGDDATLNTAQPLFQPLAPPAPGTGVRRGSSEAWSSNSPSVKPNGEDTFASCPTPVSALEYDDDEVIVASPSKLAIDFGEDLSDESSEREVVHSTTGAKILQRQRSESTNGAVALPMPPQRGQRFSGDNGNICMYIQRSKNANVVVYEAQYNAATGIFDTKNPLHPYWLDLEPSYQEKNRKKGKMDDRSDLIYIEKKMAYGVSTKPTVHTKNEFEVTFVALKKRTMQLRVVKRNGFFVAVVVGSVDGREAFLERIYVKADDSGWTPSVEYIDMFGTCCSTGHMINERIKP